MSRGYVYVLTNEAMPGLVKIGKTARDVNQRALELFQTGVPVPFEVAHSVFSPDCTQLEASIHGCLPDKRVSGSREFFRMEPHEAAEFVDYMLREQLEDWVSEFAEGFQLVEEPFVLRLDKLETVANELNAHMFDVVAALSGVTADELRPALARWHSFVERRKEEVNRAISLRVVGE